MSSPEERQRHSRRIKRKTKERISSKIAKELLVSKKYRQRIVEDKRGKEHDLATLNHRQLIELIQDDE